MRLTRTSDLWWKNAVVYCLDVETYQDGNGDGIGDFAGLTQRIDHLVRLGVTCVWLMPFYPTRERDDGYDITDFYGVDPRLGTLGDFAEFVRTARDRGIRVIADLVVNHTSEDHPWFQDARSSRDSAHRDWYVWKDEPPEDGPQGVVFPDAEDSLWEYDEGSGQYYLHRFYKQQPDLNVAHPEVRDEIARIMGFWTQLGLSGFRVDAVPFLLETDGQSDAGDLPDPHEYLADLRAFLGRRNGESVLLGEVNLPYDGTTRFFGDPSSDRGDELTMCFDFVGMQQMYLSMARHDARPLAAALRDRPAAPRDAHWAVFVRNHDELTLDKLSDSERAEVFASFGPEKDMQLYDRGLRRRLPPMVDGDRRRVELAYSLLFTLPGTPVLFYGEELGMGENLAAEGRHGRTHPDAVDPGEGRRVLHRRAGRLPQPAGGRRVRSPEDQRVRAEPRPCFPAEPHASVHRTLPGGPRTGVGRLPLAEHGRGRGPGARLPRRRRHRAGRAQLRGPASHRTAGTGRGRIRRTVDGPARRGTHRSQGGRGRHVPRRPAPVRLSVAPRRHPGGRP
ncbi:trehalose synthase [Streptomyces sviceus ATCC 29083]|uniref:Trehalose synthase n=1 Tax=Streptomyces sviceus (strain ATCC 29083 / DSM 924 / JCM 4929 / NBRC 13980 / NCIMB 11184 / NRRL 5439 / UC 5370) TaxID=463191 RepID=B5HRA7_STRX2|nr:trehalose synthase [Streptomyces sviceus ATCC 29083]